MHRRRLGKRCAELGRGKQGQADRHPSVADMQDQDERIANRLPSLPPGKPDHLCRGCESQKRAWQPAGRRRNPSEQRKCCQADCCHIEPVRLTRQSLRDSAFGEPVAGKGRDDPAANQRDQQRDKCHRQLPGKRGIDKNAGRCQMIEPIGNAEQHHQADDRRIAIVGLDDFARGTRCQDQIEANVDRSRDRRSKSVPENSTASRPANHSPNRPASGAPAIGSRPVQLGMAVNRKPAITAPTKPNSISCRCHASASNAEGIVTCPARRTARAPAPRPPIVRRRGRTA